MDDKESEEPKTKSDVRALRSKFEHFSEKSSDRGSDAQRTTRLHDPPESRKVPARKKETCSPEVEKSSNVSKGENTMAGYDSLDVFQMPLCLIETDSDGKLNTCQDVLTQIRKIDHPLNIVCIAGPYRTGKSYLLTRLAGCSKGFPLGSTIESKTKGIWVWCRPHPVKKDQVLLLLDTEGLGDIQKGDRNNDNQILALGILLSSTIVYNILGKFSNDDLESLSFVTAIAQNIQFSDKMSMEESRSNFDRVFPTFILTLRDFCLELIYRDKQITSDEYLELVCLKLQPESSQKTHNNNMVRLCLREYFKIRKCFTFERPGPRAILSRLEDLQDEDLEKDFIKDSKLFTDFVHNKCPPKQMNNGRPVNGRQFVILVQSYVDAIRKGKVPNVEDAMNTLINLENTRALDESVRIYRSGMNKLQYPTPDNGTLLASHTACFNEAFDFFRRNSLYDVEGKYCNLAKSRITKEYENFKTRDQEESAKKSQEALDELEAVIKQNVKDRRYHRRDGYKVYLEDIKNVETKYEAHTELGCKKTEILDKYRRETASRGQIIMQADETLTRKEKEIEAERRVIAEAEGQNQMDKSLLEKQKRLHEEELRMYKEALEKQKQMIADEIEKERVHLQTVLEHRLEEKKRLEKEGFHEEAERVNSNAGKLNEELSQYQKEGAFSLFVRAVKKLIWE